MARSYKAPNGRVILRRGNGQFRRADPREFGIGGVCKVCNHLLLEHYDGDPLDRPRDPGKIRYRCFTCEPRSETVPTLVSGEGSNEDARQSG